MEKQETLGTIWEVPDELWERIEPIILEQDPPKARGRKRADPRQMLNGIIFRLRSGCQWNHLPKGIIYISKQAKNLVFPSPNFIQDGNNNHI